MIAIGHDGFGLTSLGEWQRIRRAVVPGWMIDECTAARERGDWRAACGSAGFDVLFDEAGPAAGLLAGFAPDLLRWHLPRASGGSSAPAPGCRYVLAPDTTVTPDTTVLLVRTFRTERPTVDRLPLRDLPAERIFPVPVHLWDARAAAGLAEVTAGPPASVVEPASVAEPEEEIQHWIEAGWTVTDSPADKRYFDSHTRGLDPRWVGLELQRLAGQFGVDAWSLYSVWSRAQVHLTWTGSRLGICRVRGGKTVTKPILMMHPDLLRAPVDRVLVRDGLLTPAELHPLVRAALFPSAGHADPADLRALRALPAEEMVRVRCRGGWHWVGVRAGRIELPEHTAEERQREHSIAAFGGTMGGCFQAEKAWTGGGGRLPKLLRRHHRELILRLEHGGARGLTEMLGAGLDPFLRDSRGRTLIHMLQTFGDPGLLPRLLATGLDIDARDRQGYTPLFEAVDQRWPSRFVIALVDAGADLRKYFPDTESARQYLDRITTHADADRLTSIAYLRRTL